MEKVLGINEIDAENNFFELGGNSLVAMRLLPLLEEAFHTSLSIRHVFEYPTITEFILFLQKEKHLWRINFYPLSSQI